MRWMIAVDQRLRPNHFTLQLMNMASKSNQAAKTSKQGLVSANRKESNGRKARVVQDKKDDKYGKDSNSSSQLDSRQLGLRFFSDDDYHGKIVRATGVAEQEKETNGNGIGSEKTHLVLSPLGRSYAWRFRSTHN